MLADQMDMHFLQVQLDLADQWISRRARWWGLLLPRSWLGEGLRQWPKSNSFQVLGDVFQHWGIWSEMDELQLQLTELELQKYGNPCYGAEARLLSFSSKANTLLHSYGNASGSCPCGCRSSAFTETSLRSKGLRVLCYVSSQWGSSLSPSSRSSPTIGSTRWSHLQWRLQGESLPTRPYSITNAGSLALFHSCSELCEIQGPAICNRSSTSN